MINTKFLALLTLMLCMTVPIIAGFMMPSDEVERTGYNTLNPMYITSSLNNDTIEIPVEYDSYLNNQFVLSDGTFFPGGTVTTTPTNYPAYVSGVDYYITHSGTLNLKTTFTQEVFLMRVSGDSEIQVDGHTISMLYYYGKTGNAYATFGDGMIHQISTTVDVIQNTTTTNNLYVIAFHQVALDGKYYYVDPSKGFVLYADTAAWTNTQQNSKITMIMKSPSRTQDLSFLGDAGRDYVSMLVTDGRLFIEGQELGRLLTYPMLMVVADGVNHTITFTGLSGMNNYTDDVTKHKGNSVTVSCDNDLFYNFTVSEDTRYLVKSTEVKSLNVSAMTNVTLNAANYYPNSQWLFNLKGLNIYGDSITFTAGDVTRTYTVSDGKIIGLHLNGSEKDVPLKEITIALIPKSDGSGNTLRINGEIWTEAPTIPSSSTVTAKLNDTWKMDVSLAKVEPYSYKEYVWASGSFNIDSQTYSVIGLITSFIMAVLCGLAAYRFEISGAIPVIIASGCGVVYLLLMMSF